MFKLIYKDLGISSNKAINIFKKENNINKIGHTGTLDVLAQGLLLLATDDDTKLIPYISNKEKEYKVIAKLGFISKTYDSEGPISFCSKKIPSEKEVFQVVNSFIGKIKQKPPIYSSKKINGKKAYELARKNKEVKLKEISIEIFDIFDIKYKYPFIEFKT
ncbi:MAG: tRNA pseudouridine(55) synthase TruB, partial [Mycoplasmataceae bacterium]|nr:tRNA pseudouridine(55) synthase TruB [Mycoplasmataceae bacterium]